jgi:hypothetical protein
LIDPTTLLQPTEYARRLAERRDADLIRQLAGFGITLGWLFTILGGFCWFCVESRFDLLWSLVYCLGLILLFLGTVLPQSLYWPHKVWMGIAHFQGRIVMTVALTIVYFVLFWPMGLWERRRLKASNPFFRWDSDTPSIISQWHRLPAAESVPVADTSVSRKSRSMIRLFFESIGFFIRRGHYLLLPILLILLVLGIILFFVQSSVLAPFIYTI